jgi:hypothetical protein
MIMRFCAVFTIVCVTAMAGCITTKEHKTVAIEIGDETATKTAAQTQGIILEYLVYTPAKLPLSHFFSRFLRGEFADALKKIDLNYKAANSDNEAIQTLLDHGFVPVYVRMRNQSSTGVGGIFSTLSLTSPEHGEFAPVPPDDLPSQLKELNLNAVAANIHNTVVVVAAVVGIVVLAAKSGSVGNIFGGWHDEVNEPSKFDSIYNSTTRKVSISYRDYLLADRVIESQETVQGLVFFRISDHVNRETLRLSLPSVLN